MRFSRAQLDAQVGREVDDLVGDEPALLFVGINPGLWTAAADAHFAHPGNRFYPALHRAGITAWEVDASDGYRDEDVEHLLERGIAITNIVSRATARAADLAATELREGAARLERKVRRWHPRVVAIVGVTAYRVAFDAPRAATGEQPRQLGGARLWVLGNPSGLNGHETVDTLASAYREPALAAGVPLDDPRR